MSSESKILAICDPHGADAEITAALKKICDLTEVNHPLRAYALTQREKFEGIYVSGQYADSALRMGRQFQNDRILESMPDGVAVLDSDNVIVWANDWLRKWVNRGNIVGESFFPAVGGPSLVGAETCPFRQALATGRAAGANLRFADDRYWHVHASLLSGEPVRGGEENRAGEAVRHLIVTARDVTAEVQQRQKLIAIHKAGEELAILTAEEVCNMTVDQRIEFVKSNIIHSTKDVLKFDVVEIRLKEKDGRLRPLLSCGLDPEARDRILYSRTEDNGVTGFVAATGKSYLCEDTAKDPLFLEGFKGSRSSLTVPLLHQDETIGTFNVESPKPNAFTEADTQFLEIFSRNVAGALHTLELLVAQKATAAIGCVESIHREVALPVDEILNDAVHVVERYMGQDPEVVARIQRVLKNAREIAQVIQRVGRQLAPADAVPVATELEHAALLGKRVLVADADESVRKTAHELLEKYGCIVETAHHGEAAVEMMRNSMRETPYDAVMSDIRLPDMSGYGLMCRLREIMDPVPLILMQSFGWDAGHTLVKARTDGLHPKAIIIKPFRLDQLLNVTETIIEHYQNLPQQSEA